MGRCAPKDFVSCELTRLFQARSARALARKLGSGRTDSRAQQRYVACLKALRTSSLFFVLPLRKIALPDTLPAAGAEDKALPGGNLSADSGARPSWGSKSEPQRSNQKLGWHQSVKSQGPWGRSPQKISLLLTTVPSVPLIFQVRSFVGHMSPPSTSA
jgi:hypothetical protein